MTQFAQMARRMITGFSTVSHENCMSVIYEANMTYGSSTGSVTACTRLTVLVVKGLFLKKDS